MKLNFDPKAFKVGMRTFAIMIAVGLTITLLRTFAPPACRFGSYRGRFYP